MLALDHVALVVRQLEPVLARCLSHGLTAGPIEAFPGEGTREVYLGEPDRPARVLLMQPSDATGPYARALARRGPGLHHLALHLPQLDAFLVGPHGWLLHPATLATLPGNRTAWLARPGVGTLLELHESAVSYSGPAVVEQVEVPLTSGLERLLPLEVDGERVSGLAGTVDGEARLQLAGQWVRVAALVDPAD